MRLFICLFFTALIAFTATCANAGEIFDTKAAQEHIKKGRVLMVKKQYDKAVAEFDEALAIAPDNAEAMYLKGYARYEQGKMPMAYDAFSDAYEADWKYEPEKRSK